MCYDEVMSSAVQQIVECQYLLSHHALARSQIAMHDVILGHHLVRQRGDLRTPAILNTLSELHQTSIE